MALPIITAQEEQSPITATLVSSSMDLTTVIDAYAPVPMWPKIELYSRLPSAHMLSLSMAGHADLRKAADKTARNAGKAA